MANVPQQDGEERQKVSSTDQVYQSVWEARERGRVATRQTIQADTGLALTIVDDRVKHLKSMGRIRLAGGLAGAYEPSDDRNEDRAISCTILPNGRCKVEVGDCILDLSPREARFLSVNMAGHVVMEFAYLHEERRIGADMARLEALVRQQAKQIRTLVAKTAEARRARDQNDLFDPQPKRIAQ